ncbi:small VCP/p97-interacting protein [Lepeophtheirus salmonis]|uniref:small VCP/p97-interacting protein n=1 Tax=Lepeophtheirus salmonis TaxID=72036 RepID=UPI001AE78B58|nr:small VCP/p97-interacting protein-like [Lepeophtheirus salmonis]
MGNCFEATSRPDEDGPSPDEMRQRQAEAAERRIKQEESRGLKDPESYKRKLMEKEKRENTAQNTSGEGGLKWTVSN